MNSIFSKLTIFNILFVSLFINTIETVSADESIDILPITEISQEIVVQDSVQENTESNLQETSLEENTLTTDENLVVLQQTSEIQEEISSPQEVLPEQTFFVVTAYYSPLPWQSHYLRGNYEDEVILNGRWIRWASGKEVFPWMLAAPKSYNFGTKIYLEWVWIWEVADRWWAIVPAGERWYSYDRIDIWMWHGEEWLKRALAWWKRVVPWYIIDDSSTQVSVNLWNFPAPESALRNLSKAVTLDISEDMNAFAHYITPQSSGESVKKLQKLMFHLGLTKTLSTSGKYADIENDLIRYQIEKWIIARREDYGAWYFGLQTSKKMKEDYLADFDQNTIDKKIKAIVQRAQNNADIIIKNIWDPKFGQKSKNVKLLQQVLRSFGVTKNPANGVFGDKTQKTLITYQIEKWIIQNAQTAGAGVFGPKTKEQFRKDLIILIEKHLFEQANLMAYYKK